MSTSPVFQAPHTCDARRIRVTTCAGRRFQSGAEPRREFRTYRSRIADGRDARRAAGYEGVTVTATVSALRRQHSERVLYPLSGTSSLQPCKNARRSAERPIDGTPLPAREKSTRKIERRISTL